jgi:hypothetical protein
MSPLLTSRPTVSVTRRLLAACVVTAGLAILIAAGAGDDRPAGAAPMFLTVGALCAGLVAYLLYVSARAVEDCRLRWMAAGCSVACLGMLANVGAQPAVFPDGGPITVGDDAMIARYVVWHAGLAVAALLAVAGTAPTRARLMTFLALALMALVWTSVATAPFGALVTEAGFGTTAKLVVAVLVIVLAGAAAAWWRAEDGLPAWGAMCMIAALGLSAADSLAYVFAVEPFEGVWWASLTLRAGQFAIPAVGLVIGFVGLADRLRALQDEIESNFAAEHERAAREAGRAEREQLRGQIQRLAAGSGLSMALQPIVDLASGRIVGAEALARFTGADGQAIATEDCFLDAHALDLGADLELAAVRLALAEHERLPEGLYLALNCSPALLSSPELLEMLVAHGPGRWWSSSRNISRSRTTSRWHGRSTSCERTACASRSTTSAPASPPSGT